MKDIDLTNAPADISNKREITPLAERVSFVHDKEIQVKMMEHARKANQKGDLSALDVFLTNLCIAGDPFVFYEWSFKAMWETINDATELNRMNDHPIDSYIRRVLDQADRMRKLLPSSGNAEPYGPDSCLQYLVEGTKIKATITHVVDTEGRLLCRARRSGDWTKQQSGGGRQGKSLSSCHFAAMDQLADEFGISRNNPAIFGCLGTNVHGRTPALDRTGIR